MQECHKVRALDDQGKVHLSGLTLPNRMEDWRRTFSCQPYPAFYPHKNGRN